MTNTTDKNSTSGQAFWKIAAAGASFQAGSSAVDSASIVAGLVNHLTGSVYAVGAASAVLAAAFASGDKGTQVRGRGPVPGER